MWIYSQSSGRMDREGGLLVGLGYSGNGDGLNNPAAQNIHNVGPLPQGKYTIGGVLMRGPGKTGLGVLPLTPDPANEMFGRSGFFMHGDNPEMNHTASDGCIVLSYTVRAAIADSEDKELTVTA